MLSSEALELLPSLVWGHVTPAVECRRGWGHRRPHSPLCSVVLWKLPCEMTMFLEVLLPRLNKT